MGSLEHVYGERVYLRELVRDDVNEMATWPKFTEACLQWANLDLEYPGDRDAYYERGRSNATRRRFVIITYDGRLVGTVGLRNLDFRRGEGTLGIIIRADEVNHGYGTDAIECILAYAFERLGLRRVVLDVASNNPRARRCYEKVGFVPIGQHLGPGPTTYIDMAITRTEFLYGPRGRRQRRVEMRNHPAS